ncbi:MAG: hypothetical protein ACO1OO_11915 [Flavisolibacter sp.]
MKNKSALLFVVVLLAGLWSPAQTTKAPAEDNLLFLLRQTEHINQAIKTLEQLQNGASSELQTGHAVIIVCGQAVKSLTTDEAKGWVQRISRIPGTELMACGLSLNKFEIKKEDLVPGVTHTPNGLIKAFELQKQGYLSVEL